MADRRRIIVDGNEAAASVAYRSNEVGPGAAAPTKITAQAPSFSRHQIITGLRTGSNGARS
jgi:hypothetical protein